MSIDFTMDVVLGIEIPVVYFSKHLNEGVLHSCREPVNFLRMSSSGKWRCVELALTDISEERIASILPLLPAGLTFTTDPTPLLSLDFSFGPLSLFL
jgi:hypothetical protein